MNRKGILGRNGEEQSCKYLEKKGYVVLERNFRSRTGEIDIIARKDDVLHFVEVKTRRSTDYGFPAEAVTRTKRRKLILTSNYYLACNRNLESLKRQMDVMEVLTDGRRYYFRFLENAFQEGDD